MLVDLIRAIGAYLQDAAKMPAQIDDDAGTK